MHIVTKILVVFGALFCVLLSALTIAFSTNADRLTEAYRVEREKNVVLNTSLSSAEGTKATERIIAENTIRQVTQDRDEIRRQIAELQANRARLEQELASAQLAEQGIKNQIEALTAAQNTGAQTMKNLTEEATSLRTALVAGSKRENELVDRLNDEESRRTVLEQTSRALQEQLQEAKVAIERFKSGVTDTARNEPFVKLDGPIVQARIRKVMPSPAGGEIAEINEGSNLQLRPNQKLSIMRDGKFIATLVLMQVEAQASIGRIEKLGREVTVMPEDLVVSRFN